MASRWIRWNVARLGIRINVMERDGEGRGGAHLVVTEWTFFPGTRRETLEVPWSDRTDLIEIFAQRCVCVT